MAVTKLKGTENIDVTTMAVHFVRAARASAGLSHRAFAEKGGMRVGAIRDIENNQLQHAPRLEILVRVAFAAGGKFTIRQDNEVVFQIEPTISQTDLVKRLFAETRKITTEIFNKAALSQKEFAAAREFHPSQIYLLKEKGRQQDGAPVSLETLVKLIGVRVQSLTLGFGD
jgi:transcriptional regulator with XRE-family HTH domain